MTYTFEVLSQTKLDYILKQVRQALERLYGERLKGVYLFGSYARGEADAESDIDIAAVLTVPVNDFEEITRANGPLVDISLEHGVCISLIFLEEDHFLHGRSPFLINFREEASPIA